MDSRKLWQAVLGELEVELSDAVYKTFLQSSRVVENEGDRIIVAVQSPVAKTNLEKRYNQMIAEILERIGAGSKRIEYRLQSISIKPKAATKQTQLLSPVDAQTEAPRQARALTPVANARRARSNARHASRLNSRYTFENFIVGDSNEVAYAMCRGISHAPGELHNPLYLYGGVGLGKTHLMHAVGNEVVSRNPDAQVCYITSEEFTKEFTDSLQRKATKQFSDKFRAYDVLIVDDIQFFGNKEKTQEEFFHTFNTLHQSNKQVIISSDKPPKAIPNLEKRLKSRFEWGMTVDVKKPDLETRTAILQSKAEGLPVSVSADVMEYLAQHHKDSVRELEGSLSSIIAQAQVKKVDLTLGFVKQILGGAVVSANKRSISPKAIIEKTAALYHVMPSDIIGKRRDKEVVRPRQVAIYLMRTELGLSQPKIAAHVGGRDHTTIIHSLKKIERELELDNELRADIEHLQDKIRG